MSILIEKNIESLWRGTVQSAEDKLSVSLPAQLEQYLITLLIEYTDKPTLANQLFAMAFLEAQQTESTQQLSSLKQIGDKCLLYAGLFPKVAEKRHLKLTYFVDLGRSSYAGISKVTDDLFSSLAFQFVILMDILQSIQSDNTLMPIEAYEQWNELGSQRALQMLRLYSQSMPLKK